VRVLHLFSNYKWTGPADPALSLAASLRDAGVDVVFRSSAYTKGGHKNHVVLRGQERGFVPVTDLALSKHRAPWRDLPDARRLRRIVAEEGHQLVHCHLPNDMRIAARALARSPVPLVRTLYDTEPERVGPSDRRLLHRAKAVFVYSDGMRDALRDQGLRDDTIIRVAPSIDVNRFAPGDGLPSLRDRLGFGDDDFVAGIVARVQPQRRFDLLLDAAELVAKECAGFRLVIIGRGSKLERVARTPARERGLLGKVVFFPGFFLGEEYPAMLRALDVKLFLVPGTDGTARAVREALAIGLPVVSSRRGILPELVRDGVTGYAVEERPETLADALLRLWRDPALRARMGAAARADAVERFDDARQVETVIEAYRRVLGEAA